MEFAFELFEDGDEAATFDHAIVVEADSPLQLFVDPLTDPVPTFSAFAYELIYSNASAQSAENAVIVLQLPQEVIFGSATAGGGVLRGSHQVVWNLGTVPPHGSGRKG